MEISALYHRPDSEMAYLKTKDAFQIRLRTKHSDVKEVKLLYGDPYGNKVNEKDESTWEHDVVFMRFIWLSAKEKRYYMMTGA